MLSGRVLLFFSVILHSIPQTWIPFRNHLYPSLPFWFSFFGPVNNWKTPRERHCVSWMWALSEHEPSAVLSTWAREAGESCGAAFGFALWLTWTPCSGFTGTEAASCKRWEKYLIQIQTLSVFFLFIFFSSESRCLGQAGFVPRKGAVGQPHNLVFNLTCPTGCKRNLLPGVFCCGYFALWHPCVLDEWPDLASQGLSWEISQLFPAGGRW